jgi:hypothetical protein
MSTATRTPKTSTPKTSTPTTRTPKLGGQAGSGAARSGRLRLTRRGRAVLVLLFVALCFVAFSLGRTSSQASTTPTGPATRAVTVEPGQTLWQIAKSVAPGTDPRDTVDRIREMNGMSSAPLQAGQRLIVPA